MTRFRPVLPGVHTLSGLGGSVNVHLIGHGGALALVDAATPGRAGAVLAALGALGASPRDVRHILVTHYHTDHTGSLAALQRATGAEVWMHAAEAPVVRAGAQHPPLQPRGLAGTLLLPFVNRFEPRAAEAAPVHHEVRDGDLLPVAGGVRVVHSPGHTPGHVSFLWEADGRVLFTGDAVAHLFGGLAISIFNEDHRGAETSLGRLAGQRFGAACFGHGGALTRDAAGRFERAARA